jgi:hypothetical protein
MNIPAMLCHPSKQDTRSFATAKQGTGTTLGAGEQGMSQSEVIKKTS